MTSYYISFGGSVALEKLEKKYDLVVNIQGDEPLIEPEIIDGVVKALQVAPDAVSGKVNQVFPYMLHIGIYVLSISATTSNWMEFFVSHFLYLMPFAKPFSTKYPLPLLKKVDNEMRQVVLAVCSKDFGSLMVAHAMELWTAVSDEGEVLAHEEQQILGGINMEDLHRLDYAQPPQNNQLLLRSHECITGNMGKRVGEFLASVSLGSALLKVIAQQLLDSVGKRLSNKIL
ncbi:hypothetical protein HID58_089393, partial [Brassica napus]